MRASTSYSTVQYVSMAVVVAGNGNSLDPVHSTKLTVKLPVPTPRENRRPFSSFQLPSHARTEPAFSAGGFDGREDSTGIGSSVALSPNHTVLTPTSSCPSVAVSSALGDGPAPLSLGHASCPFAMDY